MNYLNAIPLEIKCLALSSLPMTKELVKEIDNEKLNDDFLEWENTVSVITSAASYSAWKVIKAYDSRNRVLDTLQLTKRQLHDLDKVYVKHIKSEYSPEVVLPPLQKLLRKDILGLCSAVYLDKENESRLSAILTDLSHADTYVKLDEVRKFRFTYGRSA